MEISHENGTERVRRAVQVFFEWYERHYTLNIAIAALLFVLQLVHLYWLSADVVAQRLIGESYFSPDGLFYYAILIIDYTEVPALLSVSLIYINELRKGWSWKAFLFLLFLNSQWLHIFWITDEFVTAEFSGVTAGSSLPGWLAWIAILIDYLELPVIYDTLKKLAVAIREQHVGKFVREDLREA
ncbi:MAG TPA: hypothetical protein VEX37_03115 [Thermomicrobiales bacterium]|nr:hypothetical protein [Thermomicrobiales bacterium]